MGLGNGRILAITVVATFVVFVVVSGGSPSASASPGAAQEYDFPEEPKPGIEVRDDLYRLVSRVRLGQSYDVTPDLGAGTYSDPEILYLCFMTAPSKKFKCQLAWAYNLYRHAYPPGESITVARKHVVAGRLWIRVLDTVTKRVIFKRSLPVSG